MASFDLPFPSKGGGLKSRSIHIEDIKSLLGEYLEGSGLLKVKLI